MANMERRPTPNGSREGVPPPSPGSVHSGRSRNSAGGSSRRSTAAVAASASSSAAASKSSSPKRAGLVVLTAYVVVWYGLTALYSVYNTAVLHVFPFPLTVLTAELGAGVLLVLPAWLLGVIRTPSLRMSQMPMIFYVSLWHTLSNAATGAALRLSSLAAVTAVQAWEPLTSAVVDRLMAGESPHYVVTACMLPVIGGVLLVSTEPSLTWGGLFFSIASSAAVGVRDLFSKRASKNKEFSKRPLSAANTYAVVTIMSFATVVPYACIVDGPRAVRWWSEAYQETLMAADTEGDGEGMEVSGIPGFSTLALYLAASGVLLFLHSAAAFLVLEKMGSVTAFSVSNAVKRGVVVAAGTAIMGPPLGFWTMVGAASAVVGMCAYWVARLFFPPRRRHRTSRQQ